MPRGDVLLPYPPRLLQRFIEAALPPSRRENILGDLEERYRSSHARGSLDYLQDIAHLLPCLMADQFKRALSNRSCLSNRGSVVSVSADPRVRAAAYQDYIWNRNVHAICGALILLAATMLASAFDPRWTLAAAGRFALGIGWVCGTYQLYFREGHANSIPAGISPEELRGFQRGELRRQMSIHWNRFVYWILPGPLLLVAYGVTIGRAAVVLSGFVMLAAILLQDHITAPRRRWERVEIEKELARLEETCREPVV
jgi:hypothetical protein